MNVSLVVHGTFLDPGRVVAGNSVRAYYLARALVEHGHRVMHHFPAGLGTGSTAPPTPSPGIEVRPYVDGDDLLAAIECDRPSAVLVGYWELLEHFPEGYRFPLVVDVVAPRILESLFEDGRDLAVEAERLVRLYRRADLFLAGNQRQRHLLVPWLILAGFRCAAGAPVAVLPISTEAAPPRGPRAPGEPWRFVTGGVTWPWRRTGAFTAPLVAALRRAGARLDVLEGEYVYAAHSAAPAVEPASADPDVVAARALVPYGEMQALLRQCHVGVELAEYNLEREFSQSFRSVEFLRNGLPLVCNRYLELAGAVEEYDAGWVVDEPEDVAGVVRELVETPERWEEKSQNARRLVAERLDYRRTIAPLLDFLSRPDRPERSEHVLLGGGAVPALSPVDRVPSARSRRRGRRRMPGLPRSEAVAVVTRGDLFPEDHGAAVKINRTAEGLARLVGAVYVVTDDPLNYVRWRDGRPHSMRYPAFLRRVGLDPDEARARVAATGVPLDEAFLYAPVADRGYAARLLYVAARHGVRRFQAEFPAYARPCLAARSLLGGVVVVAEHNVEYDRLAEQHALAPDVLARLRGLELDVCNRADRVVAVSERDRATLVRDGVDPDQVVVIPHGVDLEAAGRGVPMDARSAVGLPADTPLLVYHGTYSYPPNVDAVRFLASEVLPRLHDRGLRPRLLAIGPNPPHAAPHADVVFTGSVPEVAPWLAAADVAVVALRQGGGTRMKVLDYLAAGVPVVSTAKGVEGLGLVDGEHALIRDDGGAFAEAVAELLADPSRRAALAAAGRRYVAHLGWDEIARRYVAEYRAAEGKTGPEG